MMKIRNRSLVAAAAMFVATGFSASAIYAGGTHSNSHDDEMMEFDPTDREFGMYRVDMKPDHTITVEMADTMRFTPSEIKVKKGDVILFEHANKGKITHEFVLGTEASLDEHAEMMKKFPGMEHEEPYMIHVAAGKQGKMLWKFSNAGTFTFGCLIPGHYDAGMKGTITVEG